VHALLSGPPPGAAWLQRIGPPLSSHPGLSFTADGGRIRYLRTALAARPLRFLGDVLAKPAAAFDLVITDYEPVSAWLARLRGIRSVGIGHLYAFAWPAVPRAPGNLITRTVLEHFAPADIVAGTHWDDYGGPILPPTIDPDVLTLVRRPAESGPRLMYLAFEPVTRLVQLARQFPQQEFHIYARVAATTHDRNVHVRPISRTAFLDDLAGCSGVIANAGFTLASECLHHGIRLLVKPIDGQLEQESNAIALQRLGLAEVSRQLSAADIERWLAGSPPAPQNYPDVTAALLDWLDAGAVEPLSALSDRLWQMARETGTTTGAGRDSGA
jgi:uncharacterized protein (TIGR00661 family)